MPHHFASESDVSAASDKPVLPPVPPPLAPPISPALLMSPVSQMARVAAQERVSSSELAAALAAIETRRTADAHFDAGTITVGEAIEQLNLDIAASEVLTEVLAQRQQKADEQSTRRKKRRRAMVAAFFPLTLAFLCLGATGLIMERGNHEPSTPPDPMVQTEPVRVFRPETLRVSDTNARSGEVTIRTLAEIKDNHPVTVLSGDLMNQISLTPTQDFVVSTSSASPSAQWTLVKHDGAAYLRGYIGAPMSDAALKSGDVIVYNHTKTPGGLAIGPNPSPITFRLEKLRGTTDSTFPAQVGGAMTFSPADNWQRIVLPGLSGDKYLWE